MTYVGGKSRLAKYIIPKLLEYREEGQMYVEPFVGGANIIDKMDDPRIACDNNEYLIAMWQALQNGWQPPKELDKELYTIIKQDKRIFPKELVAFVGFPCSFRGKWFGGFAKSNNYYNTIEVEARNAVLKQINKMKKVSFIHRDYMNGPIDNCLVYCDPPYSNTIGYKESFDSKRFWGWAEEQSKDNIIIISEKDAPKPFVPILRIKRHNTMAGYSKELVEYLFIHERHKH